MRDQSWGPMKTPVAEMIDFSLFSRRWSARVRRQFRSFARAANLGRCQNHAEIDFSIEARIYRLALISYAW